MRKRVFGKLTVQTTAEKPDGTFLHLCRCRCGQAVLATDAELKERRSCSSCEVKHVSARLKPEDICIYKNAIGAIPYGDQVLIICAARLGFEVEYRGKRYNCRADELKPTGNNFENYVKKRRQKRTHKISESKP